MFASRFFHSYWFGANWWGGAGPPPPVVGGSHKKPGIPTHPKIREPLVSGDPSS